MKSLSKLKDLIQKKAKPGSKSRGAGGATSPSVLLAVDPTSPSTAVLAPPTKTVPLVLNPLDPPFSSPVPEPNPAPISQPSVAPIVSDACSSPTHDVDPWRRAYEIAQEREPALLADYGKHLASLQGNAVASVDLAAPRSVETTVEQLLEDRDEKQWRVSLLGKDIRIREQAEKLVKFLLWFDPFVKNAVSTQPYAALAWSGVSFILPLLTSGTTQIEAILQGFNSIGDLQLYWRVCEVTYLHSSHQHHYRDLIEPLAKLYSHMIEYQARAICYLSKAQLSRTWQSIVSYDWLGKAGEIAALSTLCSSFIAHDKEGEVRERWRSQLREMQQSRDSLDKIYRVLEEGGKQTQRIYEEQRERELLQDLASAASNYEGYKNFNPQRVDGTCEWFFNDDRFHTWQQSSDTSTKLLWVSAGPGCGKSVLSRALIDERRLSTNITTSTVCHFFFKDGEERRTSSTNALCSILHQLFTHDSTGTLIGLALPSHKNYGKNLASNFPELWRILIGCAKSSDTGEIVCILDALDECEKKSRDELIKTLKNLYLTPGSPSKLKFLITSRPYDELEAQFKRLSSSTAYLRFDGDDKSEQIGKEINLVIDARIHDITSGFSDEDRQRICERLKTMEHRTYLWLHLTFDIIEESPCEYGRPTDMESLLSGLPSKISDAYEKILSRSKNQKHTEAILQIVLAAARPLTLDDANVALTLAMRKQSFVSYAAVRSDMWPKKDFGSIVKNLCGLFLSVYDGKLSFIHQTAREFLIHPIRQSKWGGRFNMPKTHSMVSLVCLDFLLLPDLVVGLYSFQDEDYPFLSYAAAYWAWHYTSQEEETADQSRKHARLLCNVAGEPARVWVSCYSSLMGRNKYWTDLAMASYLGLKLVVEDILAEEKIDVNARSILYGPAIMAASARGHKEIMKMLLSKGADMNARGGMMGQLKRTVLGDASQRGHKEIVEMLLDKGADVNGLDEYCGTALMAASGEGHKKVVEMLLCKGADINARDKGSNTALMNASKNGHKEIAKMLLDKGADVNARGGYNDTALRAASSGGHKEIVEMLLVKGADVNARGGYNITALRAASSGGHKEIIEMLLDKGADTNTQGEFYSALETAAGSGHKKIIKMLLGKGDNINSQGWHGTALLAASRGGKTEMVEMLLDLGADVNWQSHRQDDYATTALKIASVHGYGDIVGLLLDKGADINVKSGPLGTTALMDARRRGHKEVVEILLDRGAFNDHSDVTL